MLFARAFRAKITVTHSFSPYGGPHGLPVYTDIFLHSTLTHTTFYRVECLFHPPELGFHPAGRTFHCLERKTSAVIFMKAA